MKNYFNRCSNNNAAGKEFKNQWMKNAQCAFARGIQESEPQLAYDYSATDLFLKFPAKIQWNVCSSAATLRGLKFESCQAYYSVADWTKNMALSTGLNWKDDQILKITAQNIKKFFEDFDVNNCGKKTLINQ